MVEQVSTNGGYVWYYLPDLSRRWGEMEAYDSMVWVQPPGTTSMGQLFLDAYHATGDEYYYQAADKAARALVAGQLECGGWNYMIDFAGEESLKKWYRTIGQNGWRLEEFQHYYGNATFDDNVSSDAARFLLRMYLEKLDTVYSVPLDRAIKLVLDSQYPVGGWPQRYPLKYEFSKNGTEDYSSYLTFNDGVVWENVSFLIQCYQSLGRRELLEPINRGMNFYLITQQARPQAGWAQQYTVDLQPAGARTYEPKALSPSYTAAHIRLLIRFYRMTGDQKFLARIPEALDWLDSCKLDESPAEDGRYVFPTFIEIGTNKPLFVHRRGSDVVNGRYYVDHNDANPLGHYSPTRHIDISQIREEFEEVKSKSVAEATKDSPLLSEHPAGTGAPQKYHPLADWVQTSSALGEGAEPVNIQRVQRIIKDFDDKGWRLSKHGYTSNPYIGDGSNIAATGEYASTYVGDKTDTSPYVDRTDQQYISTRTFMNNMRVLIEYVEKN